MRETGTVKSVTATGMDVRMDAARPEACGTCRACEVFGEGKEMILRLPAGEGIAPGDRVVVDMPRVSPWTGIVLVLGLPVVLLVGGLLFGSRWPWWVNLLGIDADLAGAALGVPLGAGAFLLARWVDRRHQRHVTVTRLALPRENL